MKKKDYLFTILLTLLFGVLFIVNIVTGGKKADSGLIEVALVPTANFSVLSPNPVTIKKGENATFEVQFADRCYYKETEGCSYKDGKLTFYNIEESKNIYYQTGKDCIVKAEESERGTIEPLFTDTLKTGEEAKFKVKPAENYSVHKIYVNDQAYPAPGGEDFTFQVKDDCVVRVEYLGVPVNFMAMSNQIGEVLIQNEVNEFHYGDDLSLQVKYDKENVNFLGWSSNGYIADGGKLLTKDENYQFVIKENTILYANFKDKTTYSILIDPNGGTASKSVDVSDLSPFTYAYLPLDNEELTRSGYTLVGYNTKEDGSGEHYSLGAMIEVPRKDTKLYAEWVQNTKEENFSYTVNGSSVTITGYKGKEDKVICIPKTVNGKAVKTIAGNAFAQNGTVEEVIIPLGVTSVNSKAFSGCKALKKVYIPETLSTLSNDAFSDCANFTTIQVLAKYNRVFDYDYDSAMADKYMKIKYTPGKRIILVSGSSNTFGLSCADIAQKYTDYSVINFSVSRFYGILPLFDMIRANIHEGDIVIFSPEYFSTMYGTEQITGSVNWQYIESNYDILSDINIQNNSNILASFTTYIGRKHNFLPNKLVNNDSTYVRSGMNSYGDLVVARTNKGQYSAELPYAGLVTQTGMERYNALCKELSEKGAKCLFSFPPMARGGSSASYIDTKTKAFEEALAKGLDSKYCTIISKVSDYCFDSKLFYDSCYHMTLEGASERTKQLLKDLEAWGGIK